LPLPPYSKKKQFDLLLIRDNEYMDIYLENLNNKIATFALVEEAVVDELNNLLQNNICDFSKITSWPHRADGSMDYPPPALTTDTNNEDEIPENAIKKNALSKNNADKTSLPLWAWFVFIGIALAVSGGIAVFIIKCKR